MSNAASKFCADKGTTQSTESRHRKVRQRSFLPSRCNVFPKERSLKKMPLSLKTREWTTRRHATVRQRCKLMYVLSDVCFSSKFQVKYKPIMAMIEPGKQIYSVIYLYIVIFSFIFSVKYSSWEKTINSWESSNSEVY